MLLRFLSFALIIVVEFVFSSDATAAAQVFRQRTFIRQRGFGGGGGQVFRQRTFQRGFGGFGGFNSNFNFSSNFSSSFGSSFGGFNSFNSFNNFGGFSYAPAFRQRQFFASDFAYQPVFRQRFFANDFAVQSYCAPQIMTQQVYTPPIVQEEVIPQPPIIQRRIIQPESYGEISTFSVPVIRHRFLSFSGFSNGCY